MKHYGVEEHAPSFCGGGNRTGMLFGLYSPTLLPMRLEVRGAMQELKWLLNIYGEEKCGKKRLTDAGGISTAVVFPLWVLLFTTATAAGDVTVDGGTPEP